MNNDNSASITLQHTVPAQSILLLCGSILVTAILIIVAARLIKK